jgi:hypothetical protein
MLGPAPLNSMDSIVFYSFEHEYLYNVQYLHRNWKGTVGAQEFLRSDRLNCFQGVAKLKQNPEELDRILKNHIVRGKVLYRNTLYVAALHL